AGYLADRYSKRTVLIVTKSTEILAMVGAVFALMQDSTALMLAVLFAMATKSAFFSPAKYGILPETVSVAELSHANGIVQMSTYLAILLGGVCGGLLLNIWGDTPYKIGFVLIAIACIASLCTLGIARVSAASTRVMRLNPWSEINQGIREFFHHPILFWVVLAIAYFWALGLTMQINLVALGHFTLDWSPFAIALMQAMLGVGIGVGSLLAGRMSGDQIEPGLIPLGAILMGVCLLLLSSVQLTPFATYFLLVCAGLSAGLYIVPLNALLQDIPEASQKGRIIGTSNFIGAVSMLLAAGVTWLMYTYWAFSPKTVLMLMGICTLLLSLMTLKVFPDFFLRFLTFLITHTLYRVQIIGYPNIPKKGAALLVCNHVSYVDGMILSGAVPRFIRYLILKDFYEHRLLHWLFKLAHAIPVKEGEYEMTLQAFERVRESLREGHIVCIFAEGSITRTGQLLPFHKGFERIMKNMPDVPIIPVYIDELWNSIFAFRDNRVIWKLPRRMPIRVSIAFGAPLPGNSKTSTVRQAVQELGAALKFHTQNPKDTLSTRLLRAARWRYFKFCMADPQTSRLSYGSFIGEALLLARYLRTQYADQKMIGVLLPPSVAGAIVNAAITLSGKTVINFIADPSKTAREYFIDLSKTQVIITTCAFQQEINAEDVPGVETVYYEELPQHAAITKKIAR
ncbi:MAG TPA: MFS transporter, partial [Gammaproteobacteria bacterium]|nr:MFS transporter [Gammaproteobacteria bacterium]